VDTFSHNFVRKADEANATLSKTIHDGYNVNRTSLIKQEKRERELRNSGATSSLPSYATMAADADRINTYIDNDVLDPDGATGVFSGILPFLEPPSEGSLKEIKDAFKKYDAIEKAGGINLSKMNPKDMTREQTIANLLKTKYGVTVATLDSATILRIQNDILNRFADKNAVNSLMAKGAKEADVNIFKISPTGQASVDMEKLAKLSPSQLKAFGVSEEERALLTQVLGVKGVGDFGTRKLGAGVTTRMISMIGRLGGEDGAEFAQAVNTGVQGARYTHKAVVVTKRGIRQGETFIRGKMELHHIGSRTGTGAAKGAAKKAAKPKSKAMSKFHEKKLEFTNKRLQAQQARQKLKIDNYQKLHTRTQIHITKHGITTTRVQVHGVRYRMNAAVNKLKDRIASSVVGKAAHAVMHFVVATLLPILGMALLAFIVLCGVVEIALIVMVAVSSLLEALNPANVINNLLAPSSYADTVAYKLYERLDVAEMAWVNDLQAVGDIYSDRLNIKYGNRYEGFFDYIEKVPNLITDESGNLSITAFEVDSALAPSGLSLDTSAYNTSITGLYDGNLTVGISANTNSYNRSADETTSVLFTSAENGHTSNIKDIIAMTDVMYDNDMEGSDDDTMANLMGESAAQLDWNAFWQDIQNKFRWCGAKVSEIFGDDDAIERYNETTDNAITYGKVQSYALTLFYASHQSETNLSVGFYDIDDTLIANGTDQADASGDGKCVTPLTGNFKIDYFMNASGAQLLAPYIEDDNGIKCALNPASTAYCFSNVEISMGDIVDSSTQCLPIPTSSATETLGANEATFNLAESSDCWDLTTDTTRPESYSIYTYRYLALTGDMDVGCLVDGTVSSSATEAQKITAAENAIKAAIINPNGSTIDDYKINGESDYPLYTKNGMGVGTYTLGTLAASIQTSQRNNIRDRLSGRVTPSIYDFTYQYYNVSRTIRYSGYDLGNYYDFSTGTYTDNYSDYTWEVNIEKFDIENFEFSEDDTSSSYSYNETMLLTLIKESVETEEITQADGTVTTVLKNPALLNYLRDIVNDHDNLKNGLIERTYVGGNPTGTVVSDMAGVADFLDRLEDDDEELDDDTEEYTGFYRIYMVATRNITYYDTRYTHNCKGHDFQYCGGHVEIREQGVVYSITNEQVVMVNGEDETSPIPSDMDLTALGYDELVGKVTDSVDYSSLETAVSTGQPPSPVFNVQGSYASTGLNLYTSGTGADMVWEKGMSERENIAFYLVKDIFDVDSMVLKGIDIFPTRNYKEYEGWTASNMELAIAKYGTDWNEMYGFDIPIEISSARLAFSDDTLSYADSLYSESIAASALSKDCITELSDKLASQYLASYTDTKRAAVEDALSWVGRFHYNDSHKTHSNENGTGHHLLESMPAGTLFTWTDPDGNYIEIDRTVSCTAGASVDFAAFIWNRHSTVKFSEATEFYNSATYQPGNVFRYAEDGKSMYAIYLGNLSADFTLSTGQVLTAGTDYYIVLKDTEVTVEGYHGYDPYGTVSIVEKTWDSSQCRRLD
jgi:hypothetical protein